MSATNNGGLAAYVDIRIDDILYIRKLRLVNGKRGLFTSMPQEEQRDRCSNPQCRQWNVLRAVFCNWCGERLLTNRGVCRCFNCRSHVREGTDRCPGCQSDNLSTPRYYRDIVMVEDERIRDEVHEAVLKAYHETLEKEGRKS